MRSLSRFFFVLSAWGCTLLGLLWVTFMVGRVLPSDPVLAVVGNRAPQALYQRTYEAMHLDRPLPEQFFLYIRQMARGDFGDSLVTSHPIREDLLRFFPASLELASFAILFGVLVGLPLGVLCARFNGRWPDHCGRVFSLTGHSIPVFWLGIVLLLLFYAKLGLVGGPGRLDPQYQYTMEATTGLVLVDCLLARDADAFFNAVSHMILPVFLLGLIAMGSIARMSRGFLLSQLRQEYVLVLRLKGLSLNQALWRHVLPNSMGPILSVVMMTFAYLLEGAVLTETVFAWPGLGTYITNSLFAADLPAVLVSTLLIGAAYLTLNQLAESLQRLLDPRLRSRA
jgi:peptide/nickel transport system permease protein